MSFDRLAAKYKNYAQSRKWARPGRPPFTTEELRRILAHDIPDMELSKIIQRSVQSIQIKRSRIAGSAKA